MPSTSKTWDHVAHGEEAFLNLAVHLEDMLGQLDDHVGIVLAVAFGGSEGELEAVTGLLAGDILLELGQEISHAEDEVEGSVFRGLVGYGVCLPWSGRLPGRPL